MLIIERGFLVAKRSIETVVKEPQSSASADIGGQQQLSKMNGIKRSCQPLFILIQLSVMCSQIAP
jgi:hypothetical protein